MFKLAALTALVGGSLAGPLTAQVTGTGEFDIQVNKTPSYVPWLAVNIFTNFISPALIWDPNGDDGACGAPIQNSDKAAAVSEGMFNGGA